MTSRRIGSGLADWSSRDLRGSSLIFSVSFPSPPRLASPHLLFLGQLTFGFSFISLPRFPVNESPTEAREEGAGPGPGTEEACGLRGRPEPRDDAPTPVVWGPKGRTARPRPRPLSTARSARPGPPCPPICVVLGVCCLDQGFSKGGAGRERGLQGPEPPPSH